MKSILRLLFNLGMMIIMSLNVIIAAVVLGAFESFIPQDSIPSIVRMYAVFGAPINAVAILLFGVYTDRLIQQDGAWIIRDTMIKNEIETRKLWMQQYIDDQRRYNDAYRKVALSPEAEAVIEQLVRKTVLEQIAKDYGISNEEVDRLYRRKSDENKLSEEPTN